MQEFAQADEIVAYSYEEGASGSRVGPAVTAA